MQWKLCGFVNLTLRKRQPGKRHFERSHTRTHRKTTTNSNIIIAKEMNHQQRRRNRRPGLPTIALASMAAYGVYKLGSWAWSRWADDDPGENEIISEQAPTSQSPTSSVRNRRHTLRSQRMMRCREETLALMSTFAVSLHRCLEELTEADQARRSLKQLRRRWLKETRSAAEIARADELWLHIQIETLTRMVASAYLQAILPVILTVQVHLLGGHVCRAAMEESFLTADGDDHLDNAVCSSASEIHQEVLEHTHKRLVEHCVPSVVEAVRSAVVSSIDHRDWDTKNPTAALHMTHHAFQNTVDRIRVKVEGSTNDLTLLQQFLVPNGCNSNTKGRTECDNDAVSQDNILNETWDLLESPIVSRAVADCVDHVFSMVREQIWAPLFVDETERPIAKAIALL